MPKLMTLCEHVRAAVRLAHDTGSGDEFLLAQVYEIADRDAEHFPGHLNRKVRHAVMRQMLQDEREPRGLVFVRPGLYHYPAIPLDKENPREYGSRMSRRPWTESDILSLKDCAASHLGAEWIANSLGRSSAAVRQMACALGLSLETRGFGIDAVSARREAYAKQCNQTREDYSERGYVAWSEQSQPGIGVLNRNGGADSFAESERRRRAASEAGAVTYERVKPCAGCGGTTFYVIRRRRCHHCAVVQNQAYVGKSERPSKSAQPKRRHRLSFKDVCDTLGGRHA